MHRRLYSGCGMAKVARVTNLVLTPWGGVPHSLKTSGLQSVWMHHKTKNLIFLLQRSTVCNGNDNLSLTLTYIYIYIY